jgi:hypothetical protein
MAATTKHPRKPIANWLVLVELVRVVAIEQFTVSNAKVVLTLLANSHVFAPSTYQASTDGISMQPLTLGGPGNKKPPNLSIEAGGQLCLVLLGGFALVLTSSARPLRRSPSLRARA